MRDNYWNFGMIRVNGSLPAENYVIVDEKLKEFGLHFACDIVAVITDSATMMKKFGNFILPPH